MDNQILDLKQIKAETLCWGIRFDSSAQTQALHLYPDYLNEKHIHAAHIILDNKLYVNAVVGEEFTKYSPYLLKYGDNRFLLFRDEKYCCECMLMAAPQWYGKRTSTGRIMSRIFSIHGMNTLALGEYVRCDYVNAGRACKFCSVPINHADPHTRLSEIREVLCAAFQEYPYYSVGISEGARFTRDRGAIYNSQMVKVAQEAGGTRDISVELVPPDSNEYIDLLIDSGAASLIMNLEFYDDGIRDTIMPEKYKIPKERYYSAWEYGVNRLGRGQVSTDLIVGIERSDLTLKAAEEAISLGVIPILMPFRPYDHSIMKNFRITDPAEYLSLSEQVAESLRKNELHPGHQHGCASCGACSLEVDLVV